MATSFSPGSVLRERYQVHSLIGQGGMGAVYKVSDLRLPGRLCALKVMLTQYHELPGQSTGRAARQQFLTEASTLARLDHPNLPKVSDYFSLEDYDCLVMDYVPGQDLQQCIQEARRQDRFLAEADVLRWAGQLCDVLAYLHGQQPPIIHGDIKPANIKLTADGRIKLVDFGLVRPGDPTDPRTLSGSGLRGVGSLPYAALELYAGNAARIDARTDLYSLGATLYHLVTNEMPASAHDRFLDPATLTEPRQRNHSISTALEAAITAAMQPHPKDRPATVEEWRLLLSGGATSRHTPQQSARDRRWAAEASPVRDKERLWWENRWYAVLAALMVIAAVALTFLPPP